MAKVKSHRMPSPKKEVVLNLFGPGMTALHRLGLAGLWMTLKKFEAEKVRIPGGSWEVTNYSVTLKWDGNPISFFDGLFTRSFMIH